MYLSSNPDAFAETGPSLAEVQATISALASGLDARFVQAGTALASALDIIERLVASLEGVTNALDREAADASVENMRSTADQLIRLPSQQMTRQQELHAVRQASDVLRGHIAQIHKILRFLHICGHNIKIASAGAEEFSGFADSMVDRLDLGERQLASFEAEIRELADKVAQVIDAETRLAAECAKVIPQVPMKLAEDAAALQQHQAGIAELAARIAEVARDIRSKVVVALGALQIGDITRQRLEHVSEGIHLLTGFLAGKPDEDAGTLAAVENRILALLAAQAADTIDNFQREARLLTQSLRGIGPDASRLLALKEAGASGERGGGGQSFLHVLEQGIAEVARVTSQLHEADGHSDRLSSATSETVDSLVQRLKTVSKVQSDVQQMAWNTGLRCMRMEQQGGRGLAVISSEIRVFANNLETVSGKILQTFDQLAAAASSIRARQEENGLKDAGQALADSLACIRAGGERMKESLGALDGDAATVITILRDTTDKVDCEAEIGTALAEAAERLAAFVSFEDAVSDPAVEPLREMLGAIFARYTMAREREVHRQFVLPGDEGDIAEPEAAALASDDDLFDDALF